MLKTPLFEIDAVGTFNVITGVVVGLATDYCVGSTAIDAKFFFPKMEVILIQDCMKGVNPVTTAQKVALMKEKNIIFFNTVDDFLRSKYII